MQQHPVQDKTAARRVMAERRRTLSLQERRENSVRIAARCRDLAGFSSAEIVCTYVDFREEVATSELIRALLAEGRRVAVPVHLPGPGKPLLFAEIRSFEALEPNHFGILQPPLEGSTLLPTAAIPLFLVPGLAFDPAGGRLGYGLGCYDRAFAEAAPGALKVGLAFEVQILDRVPSGPHDVPMDFVVTEKRVIRAAVPDQR